MEEKKELSGTDLINAALEANKNNNKYKKNNMIRFILPKYNTIIKQLFDNDEIDFSAKAILEFLKAEYKIKCSYTIFLKYLDDNNLLPEEKKSKNRGITIKRQKKDSTDTAQDNKKEYNTEDVKETNENQEKIYVPNNNENNFR